ncbi:MAG TPA: hypothetical protein VED01_14000 [Burkholderiales bacterium]|nr:hypothetical protein [Burkholderiales bacterium]
MQQDKAQSYFTTSLCSVVLESKDRSARFQIALDVVRPLPRGALLETEFQNPSEKAVLSVTRAVSGDERRIVLTSPPVAQIRAGGYETVTRIYAAADRKNILGVHTQRCESLVDHRELGPEFR